jgi:hypothetical protein
LHLKAGFRQRRREFVGTVKVKGVGGGVVSRREVYIVLSRSPSVDNQRRTSGAHFWVMVSIGCVVPPSLALTSPVWRYLSALNCGEIG